MTITANGKEVILTTQTTITAYLEANRYRENRHRSGIKRKKILPKDQYSTTYLKEGDCMEIVMFMGGGGF